MAQAAAAHFGNFYAAGCHNGGNNQGGFIPHAAGRVFICFDALNGGKIHHIAGMCHHIRQFSRFGIGHAAQVNCHQQGGHLVIRHTAIHITVDGKGNLCPRQGSAIALFGDDIIHTHLGFSYLFMCT